MKKLKKVYNQASNLKNVMDDDPKKSAQQDEINNYTKKIKNLFKKTEQQLKRISKDGSTDSGQEKAVKMNIQRSLAVQLQELSMKFRKDQSDFMNNLKSMNEGAGSDDEEIDVGFTEDQAARSAAIQQEAVSRKQEIEKIAKSVNELAELFKDLATLVIDQGTLIDRIDYNLEEAAKQMDKGVEHLVKAEEHQKSSNRIVYCMACLLVFIAVFIVLLILKWK